jgi:drug/metabolite transporter (DMT)-like permease
MIVELVAVFVFLGIRSIFVKLLLKEIHIESLIFFTALANLAVVLVAALLFGKLQPILEDIHELIIHPNILSYVLYASITAVGFMYYYYMLIKKYKLYHVQTLFAAFPVVVAFFGYLFLKENVSLSHILAICIVVFGVAMLHYTD